MREVYKQRHRSRSNRTWQTDPWFFSVIMFPVMVWTRWYRIQNRSSSTQIRIFKNKKSYALLKRSKVQKSVICQILVPSRKKQRTTNLGTESLYNPGSISPEALSREQMWTYPGPLHRFSLHYISTICVTLILRASSVHCPSRMTRERDPTWEVSERIAENPKAAAHQQRLYIR